MLNIYFKNGLLNFRIPAFWQQESTDANEAMYFDPDPEGATLRLSLLTYTMPDNAPPTNGYEEILAKADESKSMKSNGDGLVRSNCEDLENEELLKTYFWRLAHVNKSLYYEAIFSLTILKEQDEQKEFQEIVRIIDEEIVNAYFNDDAR